jgi:hypothetical protein
MLRGPYTVAGRHPVRDVDAAGVFLSRSFYRAHRLDELRVPADATTGYLAQITLLRLVGSRHTNKEGPSPAYRLGSEDSGPLIN